MIWGLSLHSWEDLMRVALLIVGVSGLIAGLATWFVVKLQRAEIAQSTIELEEYKSDASIKVEEARKEGIEAGKVAGDALVRAAELEKEAATARLETEKIKSVVQWRTFSASQNADMEVVLSAKPGSINLRWMDGDPEAMFLAIQLSQVLQRARWSVAPGAVKPANGIIFGLLLPPEAGDDAETLRKALIAAKLSFSAVPAPAEGVSFNISVIAGAPFLYIGSRMPVVP
ncbi:hypothetical protein UP09_27190 [Bradyrhizobium sp. LTSP885]|uniref:hypothetical protein n=1 Tax=Bradyrhizobium sp. LTSP885 TaxID=1619232 RepID=UPI0005C8D41A|nr:hypothetical protein [Bradyrhizobium sp. LTSP885]KJC36966.1 hypothetical protein UP09_27190 [Bradyrhizobium sp. LTSP885]